MEIDNGTSYKFSWECKGRRTRTFQSAENMLKVMIDGGFDKLGGWIRATNQYNGLSYYYCTIPKFKAAINSGIFGELNDYLSYWNSQIKNTLLSDLMVGDWLEMAGEPVRVDKIEEGILYLEGYTLRIEKGILCKQVIRSYMVVCEASSIATDFREVDLYKCLFAMDGLFIGPDLENKVVAVGQVGGRWEVTFSSGETMTADKDGKIIITEYMS